MIIVTGASGRLGSQIIDRLLDRVPADTVGVSVRDVSRAADLASRGVRVRTGDFTEPATLDHAFADAEQVLVGALCTLRAAFVFLRINVRASRYIKKPNNGRKTIYH